MLPIIISMLFGAITGSTITHQKAYCDCYRDGFKGAYCESIKGSGSQGSCHK